MEPREREAATGPQSTWQQLEAFDHAVLHDLRAPVRHLTAYGQLLLEHLATSPDPVAQDYGGAMVRAAQQLGRMLDGLAQWEQLGRGVPVRTTVDTGALLREECRAAGRQAEGREVMWQLADEFPTLQADPALLRQLWQLLLSNALKFSAGRPVARVQLGWQREGEQHLGFYVRDNGVGFPQSAAATLFTPFGRLHSTRQFEGLGMGLAMCRRIVELHGGHISAETQPEGGCTVRFTLLVR